MQKIIYCLVLLAGVVTRANSTPADERAQALLLQMSLEEKITMLHGSSNSYGYVGYIDGNERLGIPALKMNDGPQGFRDDTNVGTTTSFPAGLTVGATWDINLSKQWGSAMGEEFYKKGSNIQLGPGMNLARVPLNGRNFEYMSGGDPYLGYYMVKSAINGIQNEGVIANAKHWVHNNQETDRDKVSANVDERTRHELYYRPFAGAVNASVGSFMCSYNKVNGIYSCENPETLANDLKKTLGFQGWVMSDWGATHSSSIVEGLDQEMPGQEFFGDSLLALVTNGTIPQTAVDDAVLRILTPMFALGLFDVANENSVSNDVRSDEHVQIARNIAAAAHVLLKNDKSTLPLPLTATDLTRPFNIALIGGGVYSPITGGGGSGSVFPSYVSTPYEAILNKLNIENPNPLTFNCSTGDDLLVDVSIAQWGCESTPASSVEDCATMCGNYVLCTFFTYSGGRCGLYPTGSERRPSPGAVTGSCAKSTSSTYGPSHPEWLCTADGTVCVAATDGADLTVATTLAAEASVTVVFIGSFAKEGSDRQSLSFAATTGGDCQVASPLQDELVSSVAAHTPATVVAMTAGGAVLTPWKDQVHAILHGFFPGQEYGNAVADILFGSVNPSGRLPLTIPNIENEVGFTRAEYPGIAYKEVYSEEMLIDYRWYNAHGVVPAFAFGHGLSYTSFAYSDLQISSSSSSSIGIHSVNSVPTVTVRVTNSGKRAGAEVAQLYLDFPSSARTPPRQLKGFVKTAVLQPGEAVDVTFQLQPVDISVWDADVTHDWVVAKGQFSVMVGASSQDIRLTGSFAISA